MKLPAARYGSYDSGARGEINWGETLLAYGAGIPIVTALVVGIFFLLYGSGFWVGLYSVPCQFSQSQPKCASWRTQRNDQHLNGNLKVQIQPGAKP